MKMCSSTPSCFLWLPSQEAATEWPKWEIKSCHSYSSVSPFTAQSVTCVGYTAADMVMPGVPSLGHAAGAFGQGSDTSEQHHFKQSNNTGRQADDVNTYLLTSVPAPVQLSAAAMGLWSQPLLMSLPSWCLVAPHETTMQAPLAAAGGVG